MSSQQAPTAEQRRLDSDRLRAVNWRRWGPYLSERQWGTVREDYSADGCAWEYFPHDHARSRAYRWGEDGLAGFGDDHVRVCLGLALWNGRDPILKERLFGLTNGQGNHGEDVKELYYYLDATPTHSYMKCLYKYPQAEFPYARLIDENARRGRLDPEFEILDTGVFDHDRYFDVFVEYGKAGPDDILMTITVSNRGPERAELHVLPQVWLRNIWSWKPDVAKPSIQLESDGKFLIQHDLVGTFLLSSDGAPQTLFCENMTNVVRLYGADPKSAPTRYFKDAFHEAVVEGRSDAVNPSGVGTKAAFHHKLSLEPGASQVLRLRLASTGSPVMPLSHDEIMKERRAEADQFYDALQADLADPDARLVQRQAFAGMIWSRQFYDYNVAKWLAGDPGQPPPPPERRHGRNADWRHANNADVLSMPDKWEYPWFAAWDLAFHTVSFALIDPEFAKSQLILLTREWYAHPNGQLPAYEWAFGDVNPPVHAWAAWRVFQIDRKRRGDPVGDIAFLERVFHKLMLNFTWWVNRKDAEGRSVFQGGFLGLDNISVFDRSAPLPNGERLSQSDGTAWMAMYALNLMRIALELALHNPVYEDIATKFFEHFLQIAEAMTNMGGRDSGVGLWDEQDEFYYDQLTLQDGQMTTLRLRSMVGIIPMFAVETLEPELLAKVPQFAWRLRWYLEHRPDLAALVSRWQEPGRGERRLLSLLRGHRMICILRRMLDETEFLSDYGVRALSKIHERDPYVLRCDGREMSVHYLPGESDSGLFGGNSNWRGPIWFPCNYLIIESLQKFHHYYGADFKIECPTGSGNMVTIEHVAEELTRRLTRLFLRGDDGRRAVFGEVERFQSDPNFRDWVPFYEYFHGDNGKGLGASHQTGWTGLIAKLLQPRHRDVRAQA